MLPINNMKIILSGGGNEEETKELDELFANIIDKNKPLLYIPVAINKIKHPYSECLNWLKGTFDKLGVNLYEMWTESELENIKNWPEKFGGVYIGGGNTFYLLKVLKETNFWIFLKRCIDRNIPIYGSSAGAIIFGYSILSSNDINNSNLKDFDGMNILRGISIFCHYKPEKDEIVRQKIFVNNLKKIIALPEKSGIYLDGNKKPKIIGKDPAWLFSKDRKVRIEIGEVF